MTSEWMIIGGLPYNTKGDGISFDKKYLPHADQLSDIIEALGGDTSGLSDVGWASMQDEWENLANGLTEGKPGNAFGSAVDNCQDVLIDGLNALGKGTSDLIDGLNRDYEEYWADITAGIQGAGGMTHGNDGAGDPDKKNNDEGISDEEAIGIGITGILAGEAVKRAMPYVFAPAIFILYVGSMFSGCDTIKEVKPPKKDNNAPGGANAPVGDEGGVDEGNVIIGGWKGLKPIHVEDPSKKGSGIKVVQTDTGVIMVVDYDQLRDAMATGPEEGIIIGLNPLTVKP